MKRVMSGILAAGLVLGIGTLGLRAADQDEFHGKLVHLNDTAKGDRLNTALHAISVETGVPENQVRELHHKYSKEGPGGVLIASVLADETKLPPGQFLDEHAKGKSWPSLAKEHHVSYQRLDDRIDHVEKAVKNGTLERNRPANKKRE